MGNCTQSKLPCCLSLAGAPKLVQDIGKCPRNVSCRLQETFPSRRTLQQVVCIVDHIAQKNMIHTRLVLLCVFVCVHVCLVMNELCMHTHVACRQVRRHSCEWYHQMLGGRGGKPLHHFNTLFSFSRPLCCTSGELQKSFGSGGGGALSPPHQKRGGGVTVSHYM